ncbi:MAG: hypothetical protein ABI365_07330 [Lysobacteraceae bacterium]
MTKILYKAKSADGKPVADFIDTTTVQEAKQNLVAQGLTDIVFLQAPQIAALSQSAIPDDPQKAREYAELRAKFEESPGRMTGFRSVAWRTRYFLMAIAALLVYAVWRADISLIVSAIVGLLAPFAVYLWNRKHTDRYQQLLRALAWGKWDEVKRLAAQLRNAPGTDLLQFDLDVRLAQIQSRQGDITGADASLEKWRGSDAKSPGLFEARLASVHSSGHDYAGYIALMERAAELSQNDPSRLVDVALAHARFGDFDKAQAALAQVDTTLLPPVAGAFIDWIVGLLHLRADHLDDAVNHLRRAATEFRERATKSAAGWTAFALTAAHCAVAEAKSGQREQAAKSVDGLVRIINIHADPDLLKTLHSELPETFPAT